MPKVSVIIPTYNCGQYICEAIDSVLAQTYKDIEIIIVDDGSSDNTKNVVLMYKDKIKYIYQNNKGEAGARNRGIKEAQGEFIAFIDADDIWLENKLEKQMEIISNMSADLVHCRMYVMENNKIVEGKIKPTKPAITFYDLLLGGKSLLMTIVVKKACFDKIGLFDESIKLATDYDMWLRFSLKYKISFIDEPLAIYRRHSNQLSSEDNNKKFKEYGIAICKKLIAYPESPRKLIKKKLSCEYYLLGKIYYQKGVYRMATIQVFNSIFVHHFSGLNFATNKEKYHKKVVLLIKPYIFLVYLLVLSIFHK